VVFPLVLCCGRFHLIPFLGSSLIPSAKNQFLFPISKSSSVCWTLPRHLRGFRNVTFFPGWGRQPHAQPGGPLFVWVISFDLSGMGAPAGSYATAGLALRIIWPHTPPHYVKLGTPSGGGGDCIT
jgi:hypothetical protein